MREVALVLLVVLLFIDGVHAQTCASYSTSSACSTANCFWDLQQLACFITAASSIAAIANYPGCSYWTSSGACYQHACNWVSAACTDYSDTYYNSLSANVNITVSNPISWANLGYLDVNTVTLVSRMPWDIPTAAAKGRFMRFVIGDISKRALSDFPASCISTTNLSPAELSARPRDYPSYNYTDDLEVDVAAWIDAYGDVDTYKRSFTYPSTFTGVVNNKVYTNRAFRNDSVTLDVFRNMFGNITTWWNSGGSSGNNNNNNSVIYSVNRGGSVKQYLDFTWGIDLRTVINCPDTKFRQTSTINEYTIPIAAHFTYSDGSAPAVSETLRITQSIQTGLLTTSVNSMFPSTISVSSINSNQSDCGDLSLARLFITFVGTYTGVPIDTMVGPRNLSDVYTRSIYAGANTIVNAYFDTLVNFQSTTCSGGACTFQVTLQTECRTLQPDGNTFISSTYSNKTLREAAYGVGFTYNSALDGKHLLYIKEWGCPSSGGMSSPSCTWLANPSGAEHTISVMANIKAYPYWMLAFAQYDIYGGILPTSNDLFVANATSWTHISPAYPYTNTPAQIQTVNDTRQQAMTFGGNLVPIVWLDQSKWNNNINITIESTGTTLRPLDSFGRYVGDALLYDAILSKMVYVPRREWDWCVQCPRLPIVASATSGIDGFAVPISLLRTTFGEFQGIEVVLAFKVLTSETYAYNATGGKVSRRLLMDSTTIDAATDDRNIVLDVTQSSLDTLYATQFAARSVVDYTNLSSPSATTFRVSIDPSVFDVVDDVDHNTSTAPTWVYGLVTAFGIAMIALTVIMIVHHEHRVQIQATKGTILVDTVPEQEEEQEEETRSS